MLTSPRQRNPELTKETILEAAAALFAKQGYDATTLQQVASAARVARGTPHYFFQSKETLYQAVLERESQTARAVIDKAQGLITPNSSRSTLLDAFIDLYWQFLAENDRFLRLLHWTSLQQPYAMEKIQTHWKTILGASDLVRTLLPSDMPEDEIKQLTLSIIGLCTFSFFFGQVAAEPLHIDTRSSAFAAARRAHLKALLGLALKIEIPGKES